MRAHAASQIAALGNAENESAGIEMGFRYLGSPILPDGPEEDDAFDAIRYSPRTDPGVRLPNVYLDDGTAVHDVLGQWFTLLVFEEGTERAIAVAAESQGIPLKVVRLPRRWTSLYGASPLLVRPDMHIAWRGQVSSITDATAILTRAVGLASVAQPIARIPVLMTA